MKKISLIMVALLGFINVATADVNKDKAINLIENVTKEGIEQVINSNVSIEEKDKAFRQLFNTYLDLDFIGKYVLGRYWRVATPEQQKEFIKLYREFNVQTWSKRFDEFKGRNFVFEGTSVANNPNQIFVNTSVPMDDAAPVSVKWRVNDVNGKLSIIDIIIENVSLAQTARNEYTSYVAKSPKGVEGLLENLRSKVK